MICTLLIFLAAAALFIAGAKLARLHLLADHPPAADQRYLPSLASIRGVVTLRMGAGEVSGLIGLDAATDERDRATRPGSPPLALVLNIDPQRRRTRRRYPT